MLPIAPDVGLTRDDNPLVEALFNYRMLHIEAYAVHVDMVSRNEVAFKLTPETIKSLVDFHHDIYSVDTASSTWSWSDKDAQLKKLHDEFVQATNRFVYRTDAHVLEGLEDEGAGELLAGRSNDAKSAIMNLFVPLLPPPPPPQPRVVDVLRAPSSSPLLSTPTLPVTWWNGLVPNPIESWKVLPTTPPTASTGDSYPNMWTSPGTILSEEQSPSPTPSYSPTPTTTTTTAAASASSPTPPSYSLPQSYRAAVSSAAAAASILGKPCSTAVNTFGFDWSDRYLSSVMPYGMIM